MTNADHGFHTKPRATLYRAFKCTMPMLVMLLLSVGCSGSPSTEPATDAGTPDLPSTLVDMEQDATMPADSGMDAGVNAGMDAGMDAGEDAAADVGPASALIEDQSLESPYRSIVIRSVALPEQDVTDATLRVRFSGGDNDGDEAGSINLDSSAPYEDLAMELSEPVVGTQLFVADILDGTRGDMPYVDVNGKALEVTFTVTGDANDPVLFAESQRIDPDNLYGLRLASVVVPERFDLGVWIAVYEDDNGALGTIRGKEKFLADEHLDASFRATSKFIKSHRLHVVMREPRAISGGWDPSGAIVQTLSDVDVMTEIELGGEPFQGALEIEDQELDAVNLGFSKLDIKSATIPLEYLGGGWVGIYSDNNGVPGPFIGNHKFPKGTQTDRVLTLDTNLQGDQVLHAKIFGGQLWADAQDNPLTGPNGDEIVVSFRIGAQSLSYIDAPPYTTEKPRHVVVKRAYSFNGPAWVTLSRDDNGSPGTLLAKKKVPTKFAGNVHLSSLYGDFEQSGSAEEYLTGQPGTYRRTVRGVEGPARADV